ncbi:MAG TPA: Fur family transcriptional regulator [Candidatus Omnitrophota bacterium]|nr:transcriptional repressor [Candidatus Omnitrophota bacterium]HNQ50375.1 Fur family transcriptional regulator [Candidatus Omnitrophota bacterium]HQO37729.1 Fur family transcriptional regulator [Candidatus Omnitrophota bacterium]HQQ05928.1 Fur family transcriptional regulator [Candidatus Omnitrophota bacterium]
MERYLARLKKGGFKLTPRRQAIIGFFLDRNTHFTAEEIWNKLQKRFARCGLPGVYRNLESLAECGILARIEQFDRKKHYGLCSEEHHHHHITCIRCGRVDNIEACVIDSVRKIKGYTVVSHFMQVNGLCGSCAKSSARSARGPGRGAFICSQK